MKSRILSFLLVGLVALVGLFLVIQLVPYGRDHTNPGVTQEPNWDSPETRQLAERACFDCHSNETDWSPWYASVAPISWLVQHDVNEGRRALNFSTWGQGRAGRELGEMAEVVQEGEMPPAQYLLLHANARLSDAEKQQLVQGLYTLSRGS
jgi:hypothetical protein